MNERTQTRKQLKQMEIFFVLCLYKYFVIQWNRVQEENVEKNIRFYHICISHRPIDRFRGDLEGMMDKKNIFLFHTPIYVSIFIFT